MSKDEKKIEKTPEKYELSVEAMLKAGLHFGHKKSRWNPKMQNYIFGSRSGVHIIDLEKSLVMMKRALEEVERVVEKNGLIMFVGTKKQAKDLVCAVANKLEMPYVNERWLGGTFTNFSVIKKRMTFYVKNKELLDSGKLTGMTKLEKVKLQKKLEKIEEKMGGLESMKRLPDLMIVLDVKKDELAIKEARRAGVKVMGIIDSNSNPEEIDYPIPANDDALSSLKYILGVIMKTILEKKAVLAKSAKN